MYWPIFIKTNVIDIVYFDDGRKSCKDTVQVQEKLLLATVVNAGLKNVKDCQLYVIFIFIVIVPSGPKLLLSSD